MLKLFILSFSIFILTGCISTSKPKSISVEKKVVQKKRVVKKEKVVQKSKKVQKKELHSSKKSSKKITKNSSKKSSGVLFQSVDKSQATLFQKGKNRDKCVLCGMNLVKYYKTNHAAKLDGKNVQYCSIHCLTKAIKNGAELENPMVVDVKSLKFIPVTEAFYVVGSDVDGTMTKVSKYAFKSLSDAKSFQKKHGGKILDFYFAWQIAKKDFNSK